MNAKLASMTTERVIIFLLFFFILLHPFVVFIINESNIKSIDGKTNITTSILTIAPLEIRVHKLPTISSCE